MQYHNIDFIPFYSLLTYNSPKNLVQQQKDTFFLTLERILHKIIQFLFLFKNENIPALWHDE